MAYILAGIQELTNLQKFDVEIEHHAAVPTLSVLTGWGRIAVDDDCIYDQNQPQVDKVMDA